MAEYQHSEQSRPEQLRLLRIREIVSTEITYNKTLSLVQTVKYFILKNSKKIITKNYFLDIFWENLEKIEIIIIGNLKYQKYRIPLAQNKSILTQDVDALFCNWETILNLSEKLLEDLERQQARWPLVPLDIGNVFIKLVICPSLSLFISSTAFPYIFIPFFFLFFFFSRHHFSEVTQNLSVIIPAL